MHDLVVALHCSGSATRMWHTLAERLAPQCRFVVVDLHGHGMQPRRPSERPTTLAAAAAPIEPILNALSRAHTRLASPPRIHLVGHSYGGAVALRVASRHPQQVQSVAVFEPLVFSVLLEERGSAAAAREALSAVEAMARGRTHAAARTHLDAPVPAPSGAVETVLAPFRSLARDAAFVSALPRLGSGALVLTAEQAVPATRRIAERLRALMPLATHAWLPGVAHAGALDDPTVVSRRFVEFLQSRGVPVQASPTCPPGAPSEPHAPLRHRTALSSPTARKVLA